MMLVSKIQASDIERFSIIKMGINFNFDLLIIKRIRQTATSFPNLAIMLKIYKNNICRALDDGRSKKEHWLAVM
jgi:hypothetical protein